jgi:hypothetical protein
MQEKIFSQPTSCKLHLERSLDDIAESTGCNRTKVDVGGAVA